jgi:type IV fimbrial biogenesis protein FimT
MKTSSATVRGLTLIELIVSLAILAIFASLAGPSFAGFLSKKRVEGLQSELVTDLQYARSEAGKRNRPVQITFGSNCYRIQALSAANATVSSTAGCAASVPSGETELKTVSSSAATISTQSGLRAVVFDQVQGLATFTDTSGTALTSGQINVNSSDSRYQLRVALSVVGRAAVCSPNNSVAGYTNGGC